MDDSTAQRYDLLYQNTPHPFGKNSDFLVKEALRYIQSGHVLDLGAGDGRNSIYLASHGFQTFAIDFSRTAIEKIEKTIQIKHIPLHTEVADIRKWKFIKMYDLVLATFVLHHLSRSEAIVLIQNMMTHTKTGGLNIIAAFTQKGDFYKKDPETNNFYLHSDEFSTLYAGWKIFHYEERMEEAFMKQADGSSMKNICAYLLARKMI